MLSTVFSLLRSERVEKENNNTSSLGEASLQFLGPVVSYHSLSGACLWALRPLQQFEVKMSGVVALDAFDQVGSRYMREIFPDVVEAGHPLHKTWPEHAVGLFVAKSQVTADIIHSTENLKFIVRHGTGYDNIDAGACKEKGIVLFNLPGISVGVPVP